MILAIDTTHEFGSIALLDRGEVLQEELLHAPDGFGTSKFAAGMEKACGVPMTVRNWRTVEALRTMLESANGNS